MQISAGGDPGTGHIYTDILIVGGGASGVSAALQAARSGLDVSLVEPTPWLGGMLTAAGVSAVDGNHSLPSGIWGEFRSRLREHYGGTDALATGWVSHTQFEPHIGNMILNEMADEFPNIERYHGWTVVEAVMNTNNVTGARFISEEGKEMTLFADISIDATEYGDLMALSGTAYHIGLDSKKITGEEIAPTHANPIIQDLTYTAVLKDYGSGAHKTIPRPANYQPSIFREACKEVSNSPENFDGVDCEQMLRYAKLPNNKYLINWPNHGNDYYLNVLELNPSERKLLYREAKNRTLQFIYFLQTEAEFSHLGIADDEYDTDDLLPYIPYHRESRRLVGLSLLTLKDILSPYQSEKELYKSAVAVGDYPLDHHRELNPSPPDSLLEPGDREPFEFETHYEAFPPIPSYSVPFGSLIPKEIDGLIVAEKSISVSSIANGTTRLQPVVMGIGQAAGAAAAIAVQQDVQPRNVPVRDIQQALLDSDSWLLPFLDTTPNDWHFEPIQKLGVSGILQGEGVPFQWANQTWIYPDSVMTQQEITTALKKMLSEVVVPNLAASSDSDLPLTGEFIHFIWQSVGSPPAGNDVKRFSDIPINHPYLNAFLYARENSWTDHWVSGNKIMPELPVQRKVFAKIVSEALDPFRTIPVKF